MGIIFDALIVPALLYKPTRKYAFYAAIFFHLFNSVVFQVGIFPFLSLAFCLFFFEAETIRNIFLKQKQLYTANEIEIPKNAALIKYGVLLFFAIQLVLPVRHWFIKDDVLWTEEGHRMSWRMMLRTKTGIITYKVIDKVTQKAEFIDVHKWVTQKQAGMLATKPDVIWQFVQRLKAYYKKEGKTIEVYALNSRISVNGKKYEPFVNPKVDLATLTWNPFKHSEWLLPSPQKKELSKTSK